MDVMGEDIGGIDLIFVSFVVFWLCMFDDEVLFCYVIRQCFVVYVDVVIFFEYECVYSEGIVYREFLLCYLCYKICYYRYLFFGGSFLLIRN